MSVLSEISTNREGSVTTVVGRGELDLRLAQALWDELEPAIATADEVVVDFTGAVFVDTAILACLAKASKALKEQGKRLKTLVCDGSHPWRALKTVGFDHIMDVEVVPARESSIP